ncbi:cytochrome c oxidase assembly mitochondrial [Nannochloropsis gaditana CCMP526]|uniref:Cytochrome c oxidase assembly protein PET191 n=1 Tax=Nannochloropsis gaditana TaxID=72520 RepID=W7T8D0_9STRA|nr:cytochrome c oxidase assembly mitochondrial [Nannochloropsis gaditana CCMP526]XP_005854903.1 cytochrome c oxidase assembly mitochondrial [Nannochloropsis gaditana CCMP526]EKU21447.1 cytochrome c oxidase assembly mitochondrial [Nannochloropsis gaditana CCMP526]EKU22362.1 cytochrome c oxidase assembly mitochondrial [Nannochloropsis gaditana CCMP526]EWM23290.1 Cytochrome c oxidase assembly protein PET191 [Nannochloropsis gaditana]|eukprot:XP_005853993.1 cytochrome c oxidase assembly mitochondrial [Nannochloropsis gaditana CCMP526]
MPKSCKEAAYALLACMQQQPCMKTGGSLTECLKSEDVDACSVQRNAYFLCKRSQLDMRTRIRGTRVY